MYSDKFSLDTRQSHPHDYSCSVQTHYFYSIITCHKPWKGGGGLWEADLYLTLKMKERRSSATSETIYESTRRNIPEDHNRLL